jgi:hypothetical protein
MPQREDATLTYSAKAAQVITVVMIITLALWHSYEYALYKGEERDRGTRPGSHSLTALLRCGHFQGTLEELFGAHTPGGYDSRGRREDRQVAGSTEGRQHGVHAVQPTFKASGTVLEKEHCVLRSRELPLLEFLSKPLVFVVLRQNWTVQRKFRCSSTLP